ncbi:MAG TPA: TIGR02453 family protein [Chloroflexota bacterium]|jgi:uncharacterized protein (TIGR02453 family)
MPKAAVATEGFAGFPDGGIEFFLELQAEQSRTWFKAHQSEFERLWKRPLELFVTELQTRLSSAFPGLTEVEPHFMRIQRDTRFARDKTPYKTFVAASMSVRPGPPERMRDHEHGHAVPGLFVSFGLENDYIGVGSWHMSPEVLARYRTAVDHARYGKQLQGMIDDLGKRDFRIDSMETLKRTPAPYPQDHPRAALLKRKGLAVGLQIPDGLTQSKELLDWSEEHFRLTQPLVAWLDRHLAVG